ncbi:MAG: efflux RND transporter periplasmic adaptor subunit [Candidatus Moraniibacteriota bacterium]|nr:MAG: efflux RND transporter periplasmic adaptor subunit [Candidatus Moranbacteria bacterium]
MKKYFLIILFLTFLFIIGVYFSSQKDVLGAIPLDPQPVRTSTVISNSFQPTEKFSGTLQGAQQVDIVPKINGYVLSLKKEPGDDVIAGEVLAILEGDEFTTENKNASNFLNTTKTSFEETKRYFNQKVDEAEANLKKVKNDRDKGNATSKDVLVAEELINSAEKLRDSEIARAEVSVISAQGNSNLAEVMSENLFIKAPFSGVIMEKLVSVGSFTSPNTPLYTITSPSHIEISVSVPARIVNQLSKGSSVSIVPENSKDHFQGIVSSVSPTIRKNTGESLVRIQIKENINSSSFLIGQYAEVYFPLEPKRDAILIPESAIIHQYDDMFVFISEDGKSKKRSVILGANMGDKREIISGLYPGDLLIIEGMHALSENMSIKEGL